MDVKEEKNLEEVKEAPKKTPEELMVELFLSSFIEGMKWGEKILESMTPEEKEELRKRFNP